MKTVRISLFTLAIAVCLPALSGCAMLTPWDRFSSLRFWERARLNAEAAYLSGNYGQAERLDQEAVRNAERLGQQDFRLGVSLEDLAKALCKQEKYQQAEESLKHALRVFERSAKIAVEPLECNVTVENTAKVLADLGNVYLSQNKLSDAENSYKSSISLYEQLCKSDDNFVPDVLLLQDMGSALEGLATLYSQHNRRPDAERCLRRALALADTAAYPPTVTNRMEAELSALGSAGAARRSPSGEQSLWEKYTLVAREAEAGKDYAKAERWYKLALEAARGTGKGSLRVSDTLQALAGVHILRGKFGPAMEAYREALDQRAKALGEDDEGADPLLTVLIKSAMNGKKYDLAEQLLMRQIALRKRIFSEDEHLAMALSVLADAYHNQGKDDAARPIANQAYSIYQSRHEGGRKAAYYMNELAAFFEATGDYARAETLYEYVLSIYRSHLDADDPRLPWVLTRLSTVCHEQKKTSHESKWRLEAAALRSEHRKQKQAGQVKPLP